MLVPGALGALNSALFIPYSWAGNIDIRLRLTNVTTYSNGFGVTAAVANARAAQRSALPFLYLGIVLIALGLIAVMLRRIRKAAK